MTPARGRKYVTPGWATAYKLETGRRLRELRMERGWSQSELARRAGLSPGTLSFIERGETLPLPVSQEALAAALGMDIRDLTVRLTGDPHAR